MTDTHSDTWQRVQRLLDAKRIVGLDLSLRSTGIVVIDGGQVSVERVQSAGHKGATTAETSKRLLTIEQDILQICGQADLVVIEGPSFGSQGSAVHQIAGLWWLVATRLWMHQMPVAVCPPSVRCRYATGKGNAGKDQVLAAVVKRYPHVDVTGNDQADALVLAALGARWLGHPIDDLPATHIAAVGKVAWPVSAGGAE